MHDVKTAFNTRVLVMLLGAVALTARGQGLIAFDNLATNSGAVYYYNSLLGQDINMDLAGGPDGSHTRHIRKWLLSDGSTKGINVAPGRFADPEGGVYAVPDVEPGNWAYLYITAWTGNFGSFDEAVTAGYPVGFASFGNPTGFASSVPDLINMPTFRISSLEPPPVLDAQLRINADKTGQLTITWAVGTLQSSPTVEGPYATVVGATSPYIVPSPHPATTFYRVVRPWPPPPPTGRSVR